MKKIITFFAALAAVLSCSKENPNNYNPVDGTYSVTLTASAPGADTKTTLVDGEVDADGKPTKSVHWSKGDAIKVLFFPNHTNSNTFNGPAAEFKSEFETETSDKANFRNTSWSWGFGSDVVSNRLMANGVAVYPSTAEVTSNKTESGSGSANNTELSFTLPDAQKAINGNIESGLNFSYAMVGRDGFKSAVESNRAMDLKFMNACALISLTMPASFEKDVTSVTISSNNEVALTGKGNVDMNYYKDEILSPFHVTPEVTETSHTVTLAKADGTPLEAGATYFAVVWPGEHEGLTISFNAADGTVASKSTKAVTLTASMVKPYTFSAALNFEAAGPKEYDYVYADGSQGNEVRNDIVGVVIFHGNPKTEFNDSQLPDKYCNGLAISLKPTSVYFHNSALNVSDSDLVLSSKPTKNYNIGGYTVMTKWKSVANLVLYTSNYGTLSSNNSGWYHGTPKEWDYIFNNLTSINEKITAAGGDAINLSTSNTYLLPLIKNTQIVWKVGYSYGYYAKDDYWKYNSNYYMHNARPIFAF
ncbi:MAG: hypothetical protein IJ314_05095 [Bacteroidales bacterium]|nr:hypothetical protein [Bacteroidales bacterium]